MKVLPWKILVTFMQSTLVQTNSRLAWRIYHRHQDLVRCRISVSSYKEFAYIFCHNVTPARMIAKSLETISLSATTKLKQHKTCFFLLGSSIKHVKILTMQKKTSQVLLWNHARYEPCQSTLPQIYMIRENRRRKKPVVLGLWVAIEEHTNSREKLWSYEIYNKCATLSLCIYDNLANEFYCSPILPTHQTTPRYSL